MLPALRPRRCWPRIVPAFVALAALARPSSSHAQEPSADVCTPAYEGAQELKLDGKLVEARQKLLICAQSTCPSFMQSDCAKWDAELEALVPTVILTARDGAGRYLADVRVSMDGHELVTKLDGRSLPVNPGGHSFRFEQAGQPVVVTSVFVPEGAKGHVVQATLGPPPAPVTPPPALERPSSLRPVAIYTLGAVGVVGLAGFGVFGLSGTNAEADLRGQPCAATHTCTTAQTEPVERKYLLADISLGIGIVALGAATYLWLSAPKSSSRSDSLSLELLPERAFASYAVRY